MQKRNKVTVRIGEMHCFLASIFIILSDSTATVRPDSSAVYILNEHLQLVTSTSLRWVNADHGERPLHSVVGGSNHSESLFVCRSPSGGGDSSRPGQLSWKGCLVVTGDTSNVYPHYQVLVNVDGSARLEWADWKQFTALPPGAVNVANDVYVARDVANSALYNFVGGLYLREQYGLIVLPPMGRRLTIGQLLVEHEPTSFELVAFKPDKLRSIHSLDVALERTIEITTSEQVVNYTYFNELYFGRGHNIPTGSSVILRYANGSKVNFQWGIPKRMREVARLRLGAEEKFAHVVATRVERQWDYFATLSAHYRDGAILMRPVRGVFRQVIHENLRPVYVEQKSSATSKAVETTTRPSLTDLPTLVVKDQGSLIFQPASAPHLVLARFSTVFLALMLYMV